MKRNIHTRTRTMALQAVEGRGAVMIRAVISLIALACALAIVANAAGAEDFYVDPQNGSMNNSGSQGAPWRTLEEVVNAGLLDGGVVQPGDTVYLMGGYHGKLAINGESNATPITIAAAHGQTPQLHSAHFDNASGWTLRGVSISPSHGGGGVSDAIVSIDGGGRIIIENNDIFTAPDTTGWGAGQWTSLAEDGVEVEGDDVIIAGNRVRNVRHGIKAHAQRITVRDNEVRNYSADGLRGLNDDQVFEGNYVVNSMNVDGNHDDMFQSFVTGRNAGGEIRRVTLRGNILINYDDDHPNRSLIGWAQGIGCFDGFFVDWVVENNVVVSDHWHGITFLGARNVKIANNTVIDAYAGGSGPSWIKVDNHKNGSQSTGNLVINNLVNHSVDTDGGVGRASNNRVVGQINREFIAPSGFDFRLQPGASAINAGTGENAPETDLLGAARPQGGGVDLGAYEFGGAAPPQAPGGFSVRVQD